MKNIRIDIVSDVVCPWCIIGYKRLEKALEMVADQVTADIHWHPFQLNPHISEGGENLREHLAAKYGTTLEGSIKARENLTEMGAELGFKFDYFDEMKTYNTFKAHQLLEYAKEQGKHTEMKLRLFSAFFGERKVIDDIEVLVAEADAVGLDGQKCRELLEDGRYASIVEQQSKDWVSRGVQGVPNFVFDQSQGISGAQPPEVLAEILLKF